jgi:hypothetical protein
VGSGSAESCRYEGIFTTYFSDTALPAVGTGFYFVVCAANHCGNATYGSAASGLERTTSVCP